METPEFWNNQEKAQVVVGELKRLKAQLEPVERIATKLDDAVVAYQMFKEDGDKDLLAEADQKLFELSTEMEKVELLSLLSGKHDARSCFITISAGDGGTEANDWAEMLFRMYVMFLERSHPEWSVEEMSLSHGTEVGIDSVSLHIKGPYAFGYMKCERGTHRLARVSPFNAQGKRQTSFATVDVTPEFEESTLEIPDKDLEVTYFARSSGPGGQNVNKLSLIHI